MKKLTLLILKILNMKLPMEALRFENVDFRYNKTSEKPVLENINISIKSGETIGIIGGTGSAKSSFVNLLCRLYDVEKGSVIVGGKDVRDI